METLIVETYNAKTGDIAEFVQQMVKVGEQTRIHTAEDLAGLSHDDHPSVQEGLIVADQLRGIPLPIAQLTSGWTLSELDIRGRELIGNHPETPDFRSHRELILAAFGEWGEQSAEDKVIVCTYAPNRFLEHLPEVFGTTARITKVLKDWRAKSKEARKSRWDAAEVLLFELVGSKLNALTTAIETDRLGLKNDYLAFGIESQEIDGKPGIFDWLAGVASFTGMGFPELELEGIAHDDMPGIATQLLAVFNGNY